MIRAKLNKAVVMEEEDLHDLPTDSESESFVLVGPDPLDCTENSNIENDSDDKPPTSPSLSDFTNDVVMAVIDKLKNPFGIPELAIDSIEFRKQHQDKGRLKNETKEHQEVRLLRQRMIQMKNRLWTALMAPEKLEEEKKRAMETMRRKRKKALENETPEEAAERKRKHAEQMRMSRKRLLALETPEQTAARIAKRNLRKKFRDQQRFAKETPEERAARKEREKLYRIRLNEKYNLPNYLAAKTGKIRKPRVKEKEDSKEASEITEEQYWDTIVIECV